MKLRSIVPMRTAKIGYIVISVLLCVLGVVLIAVPEFSAAMLGIMCGVLLIVFGAVRLTGYFSRDLYRLAFQYDLTLGILPVALGLIMLIRPGSLMNFICITMGLFILTDGVSKIQIAFESKKFGISEWWLILLFAVLTVVFGLILMFRPGEGSNILMVFLGLTFLSEGILNLSTVITAVKIVKNQKPDTIEIDYNESEE